MDKEKELKGFFLSKIEPELFLLICMDAALTNKMYEKLLNKLKQLIGRKKTRLIFDMKAMEMMTYKVGNYARKAFDESLYGFAIVTQTHIARMVFIFFVNLMSPIFPMKDFIENEAAKDWLIQIKLKF